MAKRGSKEWKYEARFDALMMAVELHSSGVGGDKPEAVIETAKQFEAYLDDKKEKNKADLKSASKAS